MSIDIIGDVHGQAEKLEALLGRLGYRRTGGAWRHPERRAVFVGDLIDRGPGQLETLRIVRDMVEAGQARVTLGNHEFNAIAWATRDPGGAGDHLRPRKGERGARNRRQHEVFLAAVGEDSALHDEWIAWFRQLPFWIEEEGLRIVHACWSPKHVSAIAAHLTREGRITDHLLVEASRAGSDLHTAVEIVLKGPEVDLPEGHGFSDNYGHVRHSIRTRWWDPGQTRYRGAYIGPPGAEIPDLEIPDYEAPEPTDRPTFIGHYWMEPEAPKAPLAPRVACVDYSAGRGGPLVAYRFGGEPELSAEGFVST